MNVFRVQGQIFLTFGIIVLLFVVWHGIVGMIDVRAPKGAPRIDVPWNLCPNNFQLYFKPVIVSVEQKTIIYSQGMQTMSGNGYSNKKTVNSLHVSFFPLGGL